MQYRNAEDAKKALEQLNGFELAGRPMKVGNVTERAMDLQTGGQLDNDELDRAGIDLGATGRLALMAKLAEGNTLNTLLSKVGTVSQSPSKSSRCIRHSAPIS